MPINPYESPRIPADDGPAEEEPAVAWPATGAFRYYQTLVWHTATPLPAVCAVLGLPADSVVTLTLRSLIDDDGSITPAFELKPRLYDVVLPTNAAACRSRPWKHLGLVALIAGLVLGVLAAVWPGRLLALPLASILPLQDGYDVLVVIVCGIASVGLLATGLRWLAGPPRIQLLCIDRSYLQLFGLHPKFLAALSEWPVPDRDSTHNP